MRGTLRAAMRILVFEMLPELRIPVIPKAVGSSHDAELEEERCPDVSRQLLPQLPQQTDPLADLWSRWLIFGSDRKVAPPAS